jgi:spoIIIJ-associated protein
VAEEGKDLETAMEEFVETMVGYLDWDLAVKVEDLDEETIRVDLSGGDRDLLLCDRAEVLEVLQYLLNRIYGREREPRDGRPLRIVVDCDGFRARKEAELREIAIRVSERVRRTGAQEELGLMNPYERRIVHLTVAEAEGVTTESHGDGVMKRVVILPT